MSLIRTPYVERMGLTAGAVERWMLRQRKTKYLMRSFYLLRSLWQLKRAVLDESGTRDYWQAGKSVTGIHSIEPTEKIIKRLASAARADT